jgi:hypothetical protein
MRRVHPEMVDNDTAVNGRWQAVHPFVGDVDNRAPIDRRRMLFSAGAQHGRIRWLQAHTPLVPMIMPIRRPLVETLAFI